VDNLLTDILYSYSDYILSRDVCLMCLYYRKINGGNTMRKHELLGK